MSSLPPTTWTEGSEEHIARHNVAPEEVEQVLYSRPRWATPGIDDTTLIYGQTDAGRHLFVVIAAAADGGTFIVTAREMQPDEKKTFRKKGR